MENIGWHWQDKKDKNPVYVTTVRNPFVVLSVLTYNNKELKPARGDEIV